VSAVCYSVLLVVMRCVLLRMLEVMRRVLLCTLEDVEAHSRGFEIVAIFSSQSATYEFTREYLPIEIECKVMACGRISLR